MSNQAAKSELWFIRLELQDFRQYLGKHKIDFSVNPKKHLTVVHAENSVGKTTMLNAIKWCLYGVTPEFSDTKTLVSDRANKSSCRVRLNFKYGELEYTALRVYDQKSEYSKFTLSTIDQDSRAQLSVNSAEAVINNILPSELSNYFLFAGERYSQALDEANSTSHIRAIRDILGFTMSESVIEDIEYLKAKNNRKLSQLLVKNKETESLGKELERIEKNIESSKILIRELKELLIEQVGVKKENEEKIQESDHHKAKELGKEQALKGGELGRSEEHRLTYLKRRQKLIGEYGYILFGSKLTKKNFDHIKTNHASIPSPHAENVVSKLIHDQLCICGREVLPGSIEFNKLKEIMEGASTDLVDTRIMNAIAQGEYFKKRSKDFLLELKEIELKLHQFNTQIGSLEKDLVQIGKNIKAIGDVNISVFQAARDVADGEIGRIRELLGRAKSEEESNNNSLITIKRKISQTKVNNSENKSLQSFIDLSDKLVIKLKKYLKNHEAQSIIKIKDLVQKNIDQSLRKEKEVVLTSNYKFELKDRLTDRIDQGSDGGNGQTLLSNLSFISALISISKDRAKDAKKSIFVPGTIAPFVIDAPFAEMDRSYRLNTFEFLPKQSHQLIIFLSTGQWQEAYENSIGRFIGKRYILINHDMTNNFEENTLTINNTTHQLNVKSDNPLISSTTIKEI